VTLQSPRVPLPVEAYSTPTDPRPRHGC
jgi:hypothetical protein